MKNEFRDSDEIAMDMYENPEIFPGDKLMTERELASYLNKPAEYIRNMDFFGRVTCWGACLIGGEERYIRRILVNFSDLEDRMLNADPYYYREAGFDDQQYW